MKSKMYIVLLLMIISFNLIKADLGYSDANKPKLEAPKSTAITSSINYSTINTNNSDTLDGYHAKAFWDAMVNNNSKWTSTYNSSYNSIIGNYWDFGSNQGLGGGTKSGSYTLQTTGTGNQFQDLLVGEGGQYQEANRGQFDVHHFVGVDSITEAYPPSIVTGWGDYNAIDCSTNEYYVYAYKDVNGQRIYSQSGAYFMVDEYAILTNENPSYQCGVDSVPYNFNLDWESVSNADGYKIDIEYDDVIQYLMGQPAYLITASNTQHFGNSEEGYAIYESPVIVTPKSFNSDFYISNIDGVAYQNSSIVIEQNDNSKSAVTITGHDNGGTTPPSKIGYLTWTSGTSGNMLGALDGDNNYGASGTVNLYGSKWLSSRIGTYGIMDRSTATQGIMVMDYNDGNYASIYPNQYVLALGFGGNVPTTRGLTITNLGEVRVGSSGNFTAPDVKVGNVRIRNNKVYYGASAQASETYNGTDFVLNPKEVGSGKTYNLGEFDTQSLKVLATGITSCNVTYEGVIYYNITNHKHWGCNSTDWNALY